MKFLLIFLTFVSFKAYGSSKSFQVEVTNPTEYTKHQYPIVIDLNGICDINFPVNKAQVTFNNQIIPYQLDDIDGDGIKDELCFMCDIESNSKKLFTVHLSESMASSSFPIKVYNEMMLDDKRGNHPNISRLEAPGSSNIFNDLYHHGVAFESELTAYRIYFDNRQNIDIYGKRYCRLELSETHFYTDTLQQSKGYGNDVLWAGSSIGCGSLKLWDGSHFMNWNDVNIRGQRIVSCGPLRSIVEMYDLGVKVKDDVEYDIHTYYTQYTGHRDICVDIFLNRPILFPFLCTGVQKIGNTPEAISSNGGIYPKGFIFNSLAASWGCDYPEMGKKSEFPPEAVGLGIYLPSEYIVSSNIDDNNYLLVIGKKGQHHVRYYVSFCASKEINGYHDASSWFDFLSAWEPDAIKYEIKSL